MDEAELKELIRKFEEDPNNKERKKGVDAAWRALPEFINAFPYRTHPELIEQLTPEKLYNPGQEGYFFHWIEHKLKELGHIYVPSDAPWRNARKDIDKFKELLKITVDDSKRLSEKVDAPWEEIPRFGGDKHYAKKIIFCYSPETVLPIFSTEHFKHFASKLGVDLESKAKEKHEKSYDELSIGQKYELLNDSILGLKGEIGETKSWDNRWFCLFLYKSFPPPRELYGVPPPREERLRPLGATRLLFEPTYHEEVIAMFSIFHRELGFPYIVRIRPYYPDAQVIDEDGEMKDVEFELRSSYFRGHDPKLCDFIVCWEDDLGEKAPEDWPEIISLKEKLKELAHR